ncbi:hypothetical protein KSP40_PGU004104 [Platanthera guangdongensis]|uniref:Uncharacterized protein n=1 Tax=Platanthera guangdongensis TaxID=2320717 RepID=A0ABR2M604_9ASPA
MGFKQRLWEGTTLRNSDGGGDPQGKTMLVIESGRSRTDPSDKINEEDDLQPEVLHIWAAARDRQWRGMQFRNEGEEHPPKNLMEERKPPDPKKAH